MSYFNTHYFKKQMQYLTCRGKLITMDINQQLFKQILQCGSKLMNRVVREDKTTQQ